LASAPKPFHSNLLETAFIEKGVVTDYIREMDTQELIEMVNGKFPETNCIIRKESNFREDAVGDGTLAYGILQFHLATFEHYKKRYEEQLEYKKANHQIILYFLMVRENRANLSHWTTWKYCK
jgi:hypothetical protein